MKNAINQLVSFFEKEGWPLDINEYKLKDRAEIAEDSYKPGWQVVEIERHRGVLGSNYYQGCVMNAFQTYWMCYAVETASGNVKELPEKEGDVTVELFGLVSENLTNSEFDSITIEPYDEKEFQIEYSVSGERMIISSLKQAISLGLKSTKGYSECFNSDLNNYNIPKEKIVELSSRYKTELEEQVTIIMTEKWEEAQNISKQDL